MPRFAIGRSPLPLTLCMGSALTLSDDELYELCARNPELQIERTAGNDLVLRTPRGGASGHRNLEIIAALAVWARQDGTGAGFDFSTGFVLPNGAMRAPNAAWITRERLATLSAEAKEHFIPLCPDFVVELRSPSDRLADLQAKMDEYRDHGARLGWLIDPQEQRVHVYRPGRPVEVLENPDRVEGDPELPGLVLELERIWAPL